MSDVAISVENLSKRYRIGVEEKHDAFGSAFVGFITRPARNLRRLRRLSSFKAGVHDSEDIIWAVKDVSFDVKRRRRGGRHWPQRGGKDHVA